MHPEIHSSKPMKFLWGLLIVALIFWVGFEARNAAEEYNFIGSSPDRAAFISVTGEAEMDIVPTVAQVVLGVETTQPTAKEAQTVISNEMNKVIEQLKKLDIEEEDLKTQSFSVRPKTRWDPETNKSVPDGFRGSQNLEVKIRDIEKASEIIDSAVTVGANTVNNLQFVVDDEEEVKRELTQKAIADAKEKAEKLVDDLDVELVRIVDFSESSQGVPKVYRDEVFALSEVSTGSAPEIEPGTKEESISITLTYEIR